MDKMETSKMEVVGCGLEISARELVVALAGKNGQPEMHEFANTAAGHEALRRTLTRGGRRVRVVMEATGQYGLDVALALEGQAGIALMVANPRAVRNFARAIMQRSKNDRLDARVLQQFAQRMNFQAWARPTADMLTLLAIARRIGALTRERTAEKNRQHAAHISRTTPQVVRQEIARSLRVIAASIVRLRRAARACIAQDAQLARRYQQLCSIPGVGEASAIATLAELAVLPQDRDVRQWVAFAGLDPREYSSGTSVRRYVRISKVGNRHLRHALFMPALVACRFEPHLRGFYEHLVRHGKQKRQALLAVARKLLHAIYGMFRSGRDYDGTRVFTLAAPAPAHG